MKNEFQELQKYAENGGCLRPSVRKNVAFSISFIDILIDT